MLRLVARFAALRLADSMPILRACALVRGFFGGHAVLIQVRSRSRNSGNDRVSLACVNECLFWGHFASMNQTPDSPFIKAEPFTKFGNWRSLAINGHDAV